MQPAFVVGELLECGELLALERKQRELLRRLPEFLAHPAVVVEQRAVVEDQVLADDALERRRLLEELPAGAARLRGLLHRLLPLRLQALEAKRSVRPAHRRSGRLTSRKPSRMNLRNERG